MGLNKLAPWYNRRHLLPAHWATRDYLVESFSALISKFWIFCAKWSECIGISMRCIFPLSPWHMPGTCNLDKRGSATVTCSLHKVPLKNTSTQNITTLLSVTELLVSLRHWRYAIYPLTPIFPLAAWLASTWSWLNPAVWGLCPNMLSRIEEGIRQVVFEIQGTRLRLPSHLCPYEKLNSACLLNVCHL